MTITDALCAYWIYQGWGNLAPEDWTSDPRVQVLHRCRKEGRDALAELRQVIFKGAVQTTAPRARRTKKLSWHFRLPLRSIEFLVVDVRTDQDVTQKGGKLSDGRIKWLRNRLGQTKSPLSFLVLPTPYLLPDPLLFVFRHPAFTARLAGARSTIAFKRGADIEHAAGNVVWDQIKELVTELQRSSSTRTLGIISGDVHFSCNLDGQLTTSTRAPRILQLIGSGLHHKITKEKREQLISAYRGKFNILSRAQGVDTHRGIRITLGALQGEDKAMKNFLLEPSVALVEVKFDASGTGTRAPLINQTYLTWDEKASRLNRFSFLHSTQPDGSGLMTISDPGFTPVYGPYGAKGPPDYPVGKTFGVIKETSSDLQHHEFRGLEPIAGFNGAGECMSLESPFLSRELFRGRLIWARLLFEYFGKPVSPGRHRRRFSGDC